MSSDGKSWANLTDFMRSASLEMFQKWMLEVTAEFEKQLERQLQMSNFADTLKYTPVCIPSDTCPGCKSGPYRTTRVAFSCSTGLVITPFLAATDSKSEPNWSRLECHHQTY